MTFGLQLDCIFMAEILQASTLDPSTGKGYTDRAEIRLIYEFFMTICLARSNAAKQSRFSCLSAFI